MKSFDSNYPFYLKLTGSSHNWTFYYFKPVFVGLLFLMIYTKSFDIMVYNLSSLKPLLIFLLNSFVY